MKIYNKKSEILRDLGKDAKDIRYLERAVERGEVVEISGYYIIKDELVGYTINILLRDNKELKDKVESFSAAEEKLEEAEAARKELEINVEYYAKENEELSDKNAALESILDNLRAKGADIGYAND
jgi:predicted RNase H-like nuclease (RuvC/YqgF family)